MGDDFIVALDEADAWALYRQHPGVYGPPVPRSNGQYTLHRPVKLVNEVLAREAAAVIGQSSAPPSPGSSASAARLKPQDRPRITAQAQARAERKRQDAEREAEDRRRQQAQGTFWSSSEE